MTDFACSHLSSIFLDNAHSLFNPCKPNCFFFFLWIRNNSSFSPFFCYLFLAWQTDNRQTDRGTINITPSY